jgi:hypothetical protein
MVGAMLAVDATEGEGLAFLQSKILSLLSLLITACDKLPGRVTAPGHARPRVYGKAVLCRPNRFP